MARIKWYWWLAGIILIGVGLRLMSIPTVIQLNGQVWFLGTDSWYHIRLADYLYSHWPHALTGFDPLINSPSGYTPGFDFIIATITKALSWFIYIPNLIDYVGAALPVVLSGFTIAAVYGLANKILKSQGKALLAAFFFAILPGAFLSMSMFGYADHHVLEVLLTVLIIWSLAGKKYVLAGTLQGIFCLCWNGAMMLVAFVTVFYAGQMIYRYIRGNKKDWRYYWYSFLQYFLFAAEVSLLGLILWKYPGWKIMGLEYLAALLLIAVVEFLPSFRTMVKRTIGVVVIIAALFIVAYFCPILGGGGQHVLSYLVQQIRFVFDGWSTNITETQPSTFLLIYMSYGLLVFWAIAGVFQNLKSKKFYPIFLLWSAFTMALAVGEKRWNYYFIVPVCILSAAVIPDILKEWASHKKKIVMFSQACLILLPSLPLVFTAQTVLTQKPDLTEPVYQAIQELKTLPAGDVLSWWPYGNFIVRLSGQAVEASPDNQFTGYQLFFRSQSNNEASSILSTSEITYLFVTKEMANEDYVGIAEGFPPDFNSLYLQEKTTSMVYRLWNNEVSGYQLLYSNPDVKIYEVEK